MRNANPLDTNTISGAAAAVDEFWTAGFTYSGGAVRCGAGGDEAGAGAGEAEFGTTEIGFDESSDVCFSSNGNRKSATGEAETPPLTTGLSGEPRGGGEWRRKMRGFFRFGLS